MTPRAGPAIQVLPLRPGPRDSERSPAAQVFTQRPRPMCYRPMLRKRIKGPEHVFLPGPTVCPGGSETLDQRYGREFESPYGQIILPIFQGRVGPCCQLRGSHI
jgi:hypothetical protein